LPVVKGSARRALNEDEISDLGGGSVKLLMDTVDSYIKQPIRLHEVPFLLSIEGVFMAEGRGTVLTGKVETGILKLGDPLELIGGREALATLCMGLEMFHKSLELLKLVIMWVCWLGM
jgi:elongation factor Tu